jgi:hypothetical protein
MLKDKIFGRGVILAGNYAGAEDKALRRFEFGGGGDQVGGEAAGEEVAGGAGGKEKQSRQEDRECDALSRHVESVAVRPGFALAGQPRRLSLHHLFLSQEFNDL